MQSNAKLALIRGREEAMAGQAPNPLPHPPPLRYGAIEFIASKRSEDGRRGSTI
jgi:hypothetical protein